MRIRTLRLYRAHPKDRYIAALTPTSIGEPNSGRMPWRHSELRPAIESAHWPGTDTVTWNCFSAYPESLCYTSGTTGNPKGVLYTHRSTLLHAMQACMTDGFGLSAVDSVLLAAPMFHVNAWGLPYAAAMVGATLLLPGRHWTAPAYTNSCAINAPQRLSKFQPYGGCFRRILIGLCRTSDGGRDFRQSIRRARPSRLGNDGDLADRHAVHSAEEA